jgi:tetratricopeptide (TPR) repeat protein
VLERVGPVLPAPGPSRLMRQTRPDTVDDYLALARQLFNKRGNEKQIIELMRDSIALKPTALAYFYRAKAKHDSGDVVGAMNDYNEAMRLNPNLGAKAKTRGRSTGESISNRAMAMRLAMEKLPQGAAVISKNCQDVQMGPDNYKYRCTVEYTTDGL